MSSHYRTLWALASCLLLALAACGNSDDGGSEGAAGAAAGSGGSAGQAGSGGAAAGSGGASAGSAGTGGQAQQGPCTIPADANSCISSQGSCQSFWGLYTADIVKQSCPAPNTVLAGPCPTDHIAYICVYADMTNADHSLLVPDTIDAMQAAGLKTNCEKASGTWCPQ
jgi:hypothetical protein